MPKYNYNDPEEIICLKADVVDGETMATNAWEHLRKALSHHGVSIPDNATNDDIWELIDELLERIYPGQW